MISIDRNPSDRTLRQFGALLLPLFLVVVGLLLLRRAGSWRAAAAAWTVAAGLAPIGALRPRALRPLFLGLLHVTFPVGWVVSHAVLLAIFALCVTPLGLAARLLGRDRLARHFDRRAETYWVKRRERSSTESHFRQF